MSHADAVIVSLVLRYACARSISESYASRLATGSGDTVIRIRSGTSLTGRRVERITQWISDHWPENADWPADIPRPPPTRDAA